MRDYNFNTNENPRRSSYYPNQNQSYGSDDRQMSDQGRNDSWRAQRDSWNQQEDYQRPANRTGYASDTGYYPSDRMRSSSYSDHRNTQDNRYSRPYDRNDGFESGGRYSSENQSPWNYQNSSNGYNQSSGDYRTNVGSSQISGYPRENRYENMRAPSHGQVYREEYNSPQGNFSGRGPKNYRRSDDRIQEDVCEALSDNSRIDASEIEVEVNDGIVTLSGTVGSRRSKRNIEYCVDDCRGVKDVQNNIKIETQSSDERTRSDSTTDKKSSGTSRKASQSTKH